MSAHQILIANQKTWIWTTLVFWLLLTGVGAFKSLTSGDVRVLLGYAYFGLLLSILVGCGYIILSILLFIWDWSVLRSKALDLTAHLISQTALVSAGIVAAAMWHAKPEFSFLAGVFTAAQFQKYKYLKRSFGKP